MALPSLFATLFPNAPYNVQQGRIGRMYERSRKAREARLTQLEGATGTPGNTTASPLTPAESNRLAQEARLARQNREAVKTGKALEARGVPSVSPNLSGQYSPRWQEALSRILGSSAPPATPIPSVSPIGSVLLGAGVAFPNFDLGQRGRRNAAQQSNYNFLSGFNP